MQFVYYIIVIIVSYLYAESQRPKTPVPKPNSLADFDVPTASIGQPRPWVFGEATIDGPNILGYGGLSSKAIKSKTGK